MFAEVGPQPAIRGAGFFGSATPGSGADRQDFNFNVGQDLTGHVLFNEYLYSAWIKVDSTDAQTRITAFRNESAQCGAGADPANGAEVDGLGRREDGQLQAFTLVACDLGTAGSVADFFKITFSTYVKQGNPPSGDIVKTIAQSTPQTGNLDVTTATSGSSLPAGYTVTVDGNSSHPIGINATQSFTDLAPGSHTVVLSGVPANCTLSGGATRTVTVASGQTATVPYAVNCVTPNTTPTVNAGADEKVILGVLYNLRWSFADPDNGPWQYTINWGDGSSTSGTLSSAGSYTNGHTYLLGTFTIRVTVTDSKGASSSATKKVSVLTGLLGF